MCTPRLRAWSLATATLQRTFLSISDSARSDVSCRVTRRFPVPAQVHFPCDRKEIGWTSLAYIFPSTYCRELRLTATTSEFSARVTVTRETPWNVCELRNISSFPNAKFNSVISTRSSLSCNDLLKLILSCKFAELKFMDSSPRWITARASRPEICVIVNFDQFRFRWRIDNLGGYKFSLIRQYLHVSQTRVIKISW